MSSKPELMYPQAKDGIYPRCVWCGSEIYAPAVIIYSQGKGVPSCCGNSLPESYVLAPVTEDKEKV